MALRESGSLMDIAEKGLAADRPAQEAGAIRVRSVPSPFILIAGAATTCALSAGLSVALIDRPVATWVRENLGSERFGWFKATYQGHPLTFGPFSLMASPAAAVGPLAALVFAVVALEQNSDQAASCPQMTILDVRAGQAPSGIPSIQCVQQGRPLRRAFPPENSRRCCERSRSLATLRRNREPNLVAEVFCQAQTVLTGPGKPDGILRIDGRGSASVRLSTPCLVSVRRLHICPPVMLQPLSIAAWPQACRWRSE